MARRLIMHIKALYNYVIYDRPELAERYGITINPAEGLGRARRGATHRYGVAKPRNRVLSDKEIAGWWKALDASQRREEIKIALKLLLLTGQRPGEVRQVQRDMLTGLKGKTATWLMREDFTKNRREHVVPLSPLAAELLCRLIALNPGAHYLVPSLDDHNSPIDKVVLPTAQAKLFEASFKGMPTATVHDLRRTAATGMRRIGVAPEVVSQILNHTRRDITGKVYDHYDGLPEKRDALERWARHVHKLVVISPACPC